MRSPQQHADLTAVTGDVVGGMIWASPNRPLWWQRTRSCLTLLVIAFAVLTSVPHAALTGRGLAITLLVTVCVLGRMPIVFRLGGPVLRNVALLVNGVAGTTLALVTPRSAAITFAAFAVINATELWSITAFAGFAIGLSLLYFFGQTLLGGSVVILVIGPAAFAAAVLMGYVRRQRSQLAAESQQIREEQAHSAALDERARIAREIHDVLAHSLAALTVQLETADALLESGRTEQAHASVLRASHLAREGMAETRRAISALRGDTLPLPELLKTLASAYEADLAGTATLSVDGLPRDLRPDVGLALYRTAQEAITNARKHAPGSAIEIALRYGPDDVALDVTNGPAPGDERPLGSSGGGYGLTGLRERAELAGGTVDAGPSGSGWRVDVRIPA
jgi:signal transduction histidine kinase